MELLGVLLSAALYVQLRGSEGGRCLLRYQGLSLATGAVEGAIEAPVSQKEKGQSGDKAEESFAAAAVGGGKTTLVG